jgi:hypothetical protein
LSWGEGNGTSSVKIEFLYIGRNIKSEGNYTRTILTFRYERMGSNRD